MCWKPKLQTSKSHTLWHHKPGRGKTLRPVCQVTSFWPNLHRFFNVRYLGGSRDIPQGSVRELLFGDSRELHRFFCYLGGSTKLSPANICIYRYPQDRLYRYIYHKNQRNVGIHGSYGIYNFGFLWDEGGPPDQQKSSISIVILFRKLASYQNKYV